MSRLEVVLVTGALTLAIAGCGGSSKPKPTHTSSAASKTASSSGGAATTAGPVRATLQGANHTPVANKNWTYTVRVKDANGRPLSGTVDTEFTFAGQVVGHESPPTHPLKHGALRDEVSFPSSAVSEPIAFQVVVHTSKGAVTLDWPVTVRP